jgi:hypothetical protein
MSNCERGLLAGEEKEARKEKQTSGNDIGLHSCCLVMVDNNVDIRIAPWKRRNPEPK